MPNSPRFEDPHPQRASPDVSDSYDCTEQTCQHSFVDLGSPNAQSQTHKSRVSFDQSEENGVPLDTAFHNYEDVLTLTVPSKENLWRSSRRTRCPCWPRRSEKHSLEADRVNRITMPMSVHTSNGRGQQQPPEHRITGHSPISSAPDSYTYDSELNSPEDSAGDSRMVWTTNFLAAMSILIIVFTFPFSLIYCIRIVAEYERAVVLRMGNLIPKGRGIKGPGLFFILPCIDSVRKVDLRTVTFAIPPQELLTRDSVTVSVDAVVYYRVLNPVASVLNIEDAARSTRLLAQTTIRNVLGTKDLAQILMDQDEILRTMQTSLDAITDAWGVKVERVEIKDVRLPIQLQRAMAAEAEAAREARAKVIAANGEQEAARSLKKAARVIATSPMAFQLRYLQTLSAISAEKNSTIFFPVPIDIMQNLGSFTSVYGHSLSTGVPKLQDTHTWMTNEDELEMDAHSDTV